MRFILKGSTRLPRDHVLGLLPEPIDPQRHGVASLEETLRLHARANPRRRPGGDDVARLEDHELRDVGYERLDAEHHRLRRSGLHALAIDVEPHAEPLHVLDLVRCDQPGPKWAEGRRALAFHPLTRPLQLKLALRHVVADTEARDMGKRFTLADVARARADHDREL